MKRDLIKNGTHQTFLVSESHPTLEERVGEWWFSCFSLDLGGGALWSFFKNYVQNQNKELKFAKF
jgi:hypothetical protein